MHTRICRLKETLGKIEECTGTQCPFWDGYVCGLEHVDFGGRPELAAYLTELRGELERVHEVETVAAGRSRFFARLNAGHSD